MTVMVFESGVHVPSNAGGPGREHCFAIFSAAVDGRTVYWPGSTVNVRQPASMHTMPTEATRRRQKAVAIVANCGLLERG